MIFSRWQLYKEGVEGIYQGAKRKRIMEQSDMTRDFAMYRLLSETVSMEAEAEEQVNAIKEIEETETEVKNE